MVVNIQLLKQYLSVSNSLVNLSKRTMIIFVRVGRRFLKASKSTSIRGANRHITLYEAEPRYMTDLFASYRSGQKETCLRNGSVGSTNEPEMWSLHQELSPAVRAAHLSRYRLRVSHMEVRCKQPLREAAGFRVQVSSPCYRCTLVRS
jgi:hypothetical protein